MLEAVLTRENLRRAFKRVPLGICAMGPRLRRDDVDLCFDSLTMR